MDRQGTTKSKKQLRLSAKRKKRRLPLALLAAKSQRMLTAYLRMKSPKVRVVNADHYPKAVLKACTNTLTAERFIKIEGNTTHEEDTSAEKNNHN